MKTWFVYRKPKSMFFATLFTFVRAPNITEAKRIGRCRLDQGLKKNHHWKIPDAMLCDDTVSVLSI